MRRTFIRVGEDLRAELMAMYGVTSMGLWKILCYLTGSERADDIRAYALNHGGELVTEERFAPEANVIHDKANGLMVYPFAHDIKLVISRKDSTAVIRQGNKELERVTNADYRAWGNLIYLSNVMASEVVNA